MQKFFIRSFQFVMKYSMYLLPWPTPKTIKGPGSVIKIPMILKENNFKKAFIVTDNNLFKLGLLNELIAKMDEVKMPYYIFSNIEPNPSDINVEDGLKAYLDNKCDVIIMFGGGSPMDCGKAIAARCARPKRSINKLQGLFKVLRRVPVMYAIPTTAGTGSETTIASVITEASSHHKASINDLCLVPKYAVLDPLLTIGLPPFISATTGMDAMCHAIEAYTNHSYNSSYENKLCKDAVKLIYENIEKVYDDGKDVHARMNMQLAAFYAGRAFTRGCVGYVHAIGHTLGGLYHLSHGEAMAMLLPKVLRAYGSKVYKRLAELAKVCNMQGENDEELALKLIEWIENTNKKMGIREYPDMIKKEDINQIITWAKKEAHPLYPTPVIWSSDEFRTFINSLIYKK